MISSTLKVAYRNAKKKPFYTFINFAGLILGVACFTLIVLYVWDEFQMDSHQFKADQIVTLSVIPLTDIWLHSDADSEIGQTGSYLQILLFARQ